MQDHSTRWRHYQGLNSQADREKKELNGFSFLYRSKASSKDGARGNAGGLEKGNLLILASGGGGDGIALSREGKLGSTAADNKLDKMFVISSKMGTPGSGWETRAREL